MNLKNKIRLRLLNIRKSLSKEQVALHSKIICKTVLDQYPSSQNIGIYLPFGNEVDLTALLKSQLKCHIPSVKNKSMQFHQWTSFLKIHKHPLGMNQPDFDNQHTRTKLNICLLPLVGFDNQGNRLGMGGGFYDRYFEYNADNTMLIGVAHDCQQCTSLPRDDWDVKLHAIITESQHLKFS